MKKITIITWLNKFPEVVWDRLTMDGKGFVSVFGWIKRGDGKSDFMLLDFENDTPITYATSSAKHSEKFAKRIGVEHFPCMRVETLWSRGEVKHLIKLNK